MSDRVRLVEDTDGQPPMSVNSLLSDERATFPQTTSTSGDLHPGDHLGCACGNFRLFQIGLERGVTKWNILAYFWAITITISAYVFINACQGYILSNFLGIGEDSQGTYTGDLAFYNELVIIPTIVFWGLASDKTGRMPVFVISLVIMALGIFLSAFARSWVALVMFRLVYALGASGTGAMVTAVLSDYPKDSSRGRAGGIVGLCAGFGALLAVFAYLQIPKWLHLDVRSGGEAMLFIVAACVMASAFVLFFGLKWGRPTGNVRLRRAQPGWFTILKEGIQAARRAEVVLAYISSFAARGDSVVLSTFLTLWINKYYKQHGFSPADALSRGGIISGIAQTCAIVFAPFVGFAADKLSRTMTLFLSSIIATAGYLWMFFIPDPVGGSIIGGAVLVGCGEIGMVVSSQILVAQEAPEGIRGSVSGFFGICASVGILTATKLGGYMFDEWVESAPFLLFAIFNGITLVFSFVLMIVRRHQGQQALVLAD